MDFKARVQFGRTGLMVSRLGLASGYGVRRIGQHIYGSGGSTPFFAR